MPLVMARPWGLWVLQVGSLGRWELPKDSCGPSSEDRKPFEKTASHLQGMQGARHCPPRSPPKLIGVSLPRTPAQLYIKTGPPSPCCSTMQGPPFSPLALLLATVGAVLQAETLKELATSTGGLIFLEDGIWLPSSPPEPSCLVTLKGEGDRSKASLRLVGVLGSYEHAFLEAVREAHWGPQDLATFGVCSLGSQVTLQALQHLGAWLGDTGGQQLLVLHLAEGT